MRIPLQLSSLVESEEMPLIRAVLFDYGLVLTGPPAAAAWARMQVILDATDPRFHDAYWHSRHDYDLGVLNGITFWQTVGTNLGRTPTDSEIADLIEADIDLWTVPNQPMIRLAATLQKADITTGILSNIGDAMENGILHRCAWLSKFSHLTFSHRLGIAKPDERIYRVAIDGLRHAPQETLFIDDRIENVEAARRVGLNAIQYTSHEAFLQSFDDAGIEGLPLPAERAMSQTS